MISYSSLMTTLTLGIFVIVIVTLIVDVIVIVTLIVTMILPGFSSDALASALAEHLPWQPATLYCYQLKNITPLRWIIIIIINNEEKDENYDNHQNDDNSDDDRPLEQT